MLAKDRNNIKVKDILLLRQKDVDFKAASFRESVTATFQVQGIRNKGILLLSQARNIMLIENP